MHDELMSSMDISQKMLELTACAVLPITSDNKLIDININNRLISIDQKINNENNDNSNDSQSSPMIERSSDELVVNDIENSEQSVKDLVEEYVNEVISEEEKHFCDRLNNESIDQMIINNNNAIRDRIIANGILGKEEELRSSDEVDEESSNCLNDVNFDEQEVIVLKNGLKVINGCVEPEYDPTADKQLRFTNQLQFLRQIMTKYLIRYKTALPFLKPVDCIKLKIPHYYNIISNPMDLTTIKRRLMFLWYSTADECLEDFKLIFSNCYKFNSSGDFVYNAGKKLEEYLNEKLKDMPIEEVELPCPSKPSVVDTEKKVVKRRAESTTEELLDSIIAESIEGNTTRRNGQKKMITRSEHGLQVKKPNKDLPTPIASPPQPLPKRVPLNTSMKYCLEFVKEMMTKKHIEYAWPFYEPVSIQQFPDYLSIVKKPIDLSTIKSKIETGQYNTVKSFVTDMRLMFTNCLRYNKPEAPVIDQCRRLRDYFEYRYAKIPEELLNERMSTNSNNHNTSSSGQQNSHKIKESDDGLTTNGTENQQRMVILETQVKLLTNAMSALTGVKTKQLKTKNGVKKQKVLTQSSNKKRKRSSTKSSPQKPKANRVRKESSIKKNKSSDNVFVDEEDEEMSNLSLAPSPIAFQYNDMEDLKQLKTDLENLDAKDLKNVLRILQTTEPSIRCDNDENIEIDFEILKPETLIALRKFVSSCMLNNIPKKSKSSVNGSESGKKSCDMNNANNVSLSNSSLFPSSSRLSEDSSDSSESSSDSESSDNDED